MSQAGSLGIVVAHEDRAIVEAVTELLDAAPDLFVAATGIAAATPATVVVAGGRALAGLRDVPAPIVALAGDEPLAAARAALAVRAVDLVVWPGEAARLPGAIRSAARGAAHPRGTGRVVAVVGARGGIGASTLAALLAARARDAIVLDLDRAGGQSAFRPDDVPLGVRPMPALDIGPEHLDAALLEHPGGRCLYHDAALAPRDAITTHALLRAARALAPVVIADAGRGLDDVTRAAVEDADAVVLVVADDVVSVRRAVALAHSTPDARGTAGIPLERRSRPHRAPHIVVRRGRRGGVAVRDIRAALDADDVVVVRDDAALARAVDLGRLPGRPTATTRAVATLARAVLEENA